MSCVSSFFAKEVRKKHAHIALPRLLLRCVCARAMAGADAAFLELLQDPITKDVLTAPTVLASDGVTYGLEGLLHAMEADPWHRSPVTREVLRSIAYRNTFVDAFLAAGVKAETPERTPVQAPVVPAAAASGFGQHALRLFAVPENTIDAFDAAVPSAGTVVTWRLPARLKPDAAMERLRWKLPPGTTIAMYVHSDGSGLMHPPAAVEMQADIVALATAVGIAFVVPNSWCLTTAQVRVPATTTASPSASTVLLPDRADDDGYGGSVASGASGGTVLEPFPRASMRVMGTVEDVWIQVFGQGKGHTD